MKNFIKQHKELKIPKTQNEVKNKQERIRRVIIYPV